MIAGLFTSPTIIMLLLLKNVSSAGLVQIGPKLYLAARRNVPKCAWIPFRGVMRATPSG
jgi:hypothetical protein